MPLETFIAKTTVCRGRNEVNVVSRGIPSISYGPYRGQDESFEVTTPSILCWRLVPFVLSHFCDILEGKNMSSVWNETTVDLPYIRCLVCREGFAV